MSGGEERPLRKRSDLTVRLARLEGFLRPEAASEQVGTPAEPASEMLWDAYQRGDLAGRRVLDLGSGTGTLAIGAALLGADVVGVDQDEGALAIARRNAAKAGVSVAWQVARLGEEPPEWTAETVIMNPPFGAQRAHADRPFLEAAARALEGVPGGAVHLFANAASQDFIERWSIAHRLSIEEHRRSTWPLPATLPHHRKVRGSIEVDRWVLRKEGKRA